MNRLDIDSIKDAVYELEGLLELAALRDDKLPELLPLLKGKLEIINSYFAEETYPEEEASDDDDLSLELTEEESDTEEEYKEKDDIDIISPLSSHIEEELSVKDIKASFVDLSGDEQRDHSLEDIATADIKEEEQDIAKEKVNEVENNPEEVGVAETLEESKKEEEAPLYVYQESEQAEPAIARPSTSKPAFCVNDRFRFRRELFKNSDSEFNYAMNLLATMDNYDEAEEYFIGELGWDFEKPEVVDFMAIIRNYFQK